MKFILSILLFLSLQSEAQIIKANPNYVPLVTTVPPANLLFDDYPGLAGYSLRKLRNAYSGSAVRIRRSNDDAEQDIGFVSGFFDTTSFKSFVGANTGYIVTWYDQSTNGYNFTTSTQADQATIVLNCFGNIPGVNFDTDKYDRATILSGTTASSYFQVAQNINDPSTGAGSAPFLRHNSLAAYYTYTDGVIYDDWGTNSRHTTGDPTTSLTNLVLYSTFAGASDWRSYINNTSFYSTGTNTVAYSGGLKMGYSTTGVNAKMKVAEGLIYSSLLSDGDRNGISGNISSFYSIAMETLPHNMTTNSLPTPYVASASTEYDASFAAFHAFDGVVSYGQYWLASTSTGWLSMDLGSGVSRIARDYSVKVNTVPEPNRAPKDWTFEGSNDNSNWDVLSTVTAQTSWSSGQVRTFTCSPQTTAYRYFRINISANNGDSYVQVGELYLLTY